MEFCCYWLLELIIAFWKCDNALWNLDWTWTCWLWRSCDWVFTFEKFECSLLLSWLSWNIPVILRFASNPIRPSDEIRVDFSRFILSFSKSFWICFNSPITFFYRHLFVSRFFSIKILITFIWFVICSTILYPLAFISSSFSWNPSIYPEHIILSSHII